MYLLSGDVTSDCWNYSERFSLLQGPYLDTYFTHYWFLVQHLSLWPFTPSIGLSKKSPFYYVKTTFYSILTTTFSLFLLKYSKSDRPNFLFDRSVCLYLFKTFLYLLFTRLKLQYNSHTVVFLSCTY